MLNIDTSGVRPPRIARVAFPGLVWKIPNDTNKIFLTFDDGPIPDVTEWVLNTLDSFNIKATFFCVGDNVRKHPEFFKKVKESNNAIGNHTFNHLNCWKTKRSEFIENIELANSFIETNLFRPPHGKIRFSLANQLEKKYKIIMWDVLSKDYDKSLNPRKCYENVINNTRSGSIIVFHDSIKAYKNLSYALPKSIETLLERGFKFEKIAFDH